MPKFVRCPWHCLSIMPHDPWSWWEPFGLKKNHRREVVFGCFWFVFLVGGHVLFGQNMAKYGTKNGSKGLEHIESLNGWINFVVFSCKFELGSFIFHMLESCKIDVEQCLEDVWWFMCICTHISLLIFLDEETGILMSLPSGTVIWGFGQGRIVPLVMARNTSVVDSTTPADYALYCWVALFSAELAHVN